MECEKCVTIMEYVCDELCKWPYELGEEELVEKCTSCKVSRFYEEEFGENKFIEKKHCDMKFDRPTPQKGEVYRHFKTGKVVKVLAISKHTETEEIDVVYSHQGDVWSRPLSMFMSKVDRNKYPDTTQEYRFEKIDERYRQLFTGEKIICGYGKRIASLLIEQGITQRELADRVKVTEVSMSRYINEERMPKASVAIKIADTLGTNVEYLFG